MSITSNADTELKWHNVTWRAPSDRPYVEEDQAALAEARKERDARAREAMDAALNRHRATLASNPRTDLGEEAFAAAAAMRDAAAAADAADAADAEAAAASAAAAADTAAAAAAKDPTDAAAAATAAATAATAAAAAAAAASASATNNNEMIPAWKPKEETLGQGPIGGAGHGAGRAQEHYWARPGSCCPPRHQTQF